MKKELNIIWKEIEKKIYNFIRKKVNTNEDAEDIFQDVYIKLVENIHTLRNRDKIESWIYQITRNTINDCYSKCYKVDFLQIENEKITENILEEINLNEDISKSMLSFIENLSEKQKKVLKMFEFENMSHKEIAKKLNITENVSKVRLNRAKEKLRKELEMCCTLKVDKYGNILDYKKNK